MNNLFQYDIETDNFHFKYRKGIPSLKDREFHDYHEFVLFKSGDANFISKNIQQALTPGSMILIPKHNFHQFCIADTNTYERCILGFRETSELFSLICDVMTEVKIISAPDARFLSVFERMTECVKSDLSAAEKNMFVNSSLIQLLIYLKQYKIEAISQNINISPIVQNALNYIDRSFTKNISVETIAKNLYVSPSSLAHKFSKELNISVYRYISQKRLSAACEYIEKGESPTIAAEKSGFSDYSCFYRMYKKRYKDSPSKLWK